MSSLTYAQLEVTTHCNFDCFYCAGRFMPQRHMAMEVFTGILERLPKHSLTVSLQGEGEPLLHPAFWEMVTAVKTAGYRPFTITNGSAMPHPERIAAEFSNIGLSLDSLDADFAERIGRLQLDRVLRNLDRLLDCMDASRIIIHTVDMGQSLDSIRRLVRDRGLRHQIQPLQGKEDYLRNYPSVTARRRAASSSLGRRPSLQKRPVSEIQAAGCSYVTSDFMRYFNVDGIEMLCPFIKDAQAYHGLRWLRASFERGQSPSCCAGCSELNRPKSSVRATVGRLQGMHRLKGTE